MLLKFHKMHGLGNDFIIIENYFKNIKLTKDRVRFLCDRKIGIGCDQLIILQKSLEADYEMIIYNVDGSQVEFCGNATRCIIGLISKNKISIKSGDKILLGELDNELAIVNIGSVVETQEIKIDLTDLNNNLKLLKGFYVNVGNPHIVFFLDDYDLNLALIGSFVERLSMFPNKVNVNFAQIIDKSNINLKVWERGVGMTLACGSGACATAFAAYNYFSTHNRMNINFERGSLAIEINKENNILMRGDYNYVFNGLVEIKD